MKAINIIDALTRMGNTEGTGIVETPTNSTEIQSWLGDMFGSGCDKMVQSNKLKPNTKYLYVYEETISAESVEDCKLMVVFSYCDGVNSWTDTQTIFLYEIE